MTTAYVAYIVFALLGLTSFAMFRPAVAVLACVIGGWALLPNGTYSREPLWEGDPFWIIGSALPSDMLVTKGWVGAAVALAGVICFDHRALRRFRPTWVDAFPLAFVLAPVLSIWRDAASPHALISVAYLMGAWGVPWFLGRLYYFDPLGQRLLASGLALGALAYLPICLVEGIAGPRVYAIYGADHPFRAVGATRYIGFRPLGFLEDGNQAGMWLAGGALLAAWLAVTGERSRPRAKLEGACAGTLVAMALAAQSVGAICLMICGLCVLAVSKWVSPRRFTLVVAGALALVGVVYLSGKLPVEALGKKTAVGQKVIAAFKGAGRGSLTWRIGQDQKFIKPALTHVATGSGQWDWWRERQARPWGLEMLILGQFGAVALLAAYGMLLAPAIRVGLSLGKGDAWGAAAVPAALAALLAITALDSLLNSFLILPVLLAAGGLASGPGGPVPGGESAASTKIRTRGSALRVS